MRVPVFAALCSALLLGSAASAQIDPGHFDLSVKPQDDFFRYVNGTWLKTTPIPPQYSRWGSFDELQVRNWEALRLLCERAAALGAAGSAVQRRVGDFFASGMDEPAINAAGAAPLRFEFDRIAGLRTTADVVSEMAHLHQLGIGAGFAFYSAPDDRNSAVEIAQLRQGGLSLPDRDYYLNADDKSKRLRGQFVAHAARMLELLGEPAAHAETEAAQVLALETTLATASLSREILRNPYASYHKQAVTDLGKTTGRLDWARFFAEVGAPPFGEVNLAQPAFFKVLAVQLASVPLATWQAYLRWHLVHAVAPYLSEPFVQENFRFFGTTLNGTTQLLPRWERVVTEIDADIGEALGQLYVADYFPPAAKARILQLVGDLRASLRSRLSTLEWMDAPTRAKAVAKLDALKVKMGYPDTWRDYRALQTDRAAYVWNVLRAQAFEVHRDLGKIGQPVDPGEWHRTPPTVNAYYSPSRNEIVFPAGILQPPFFYAAADDAVNYGGIGAVIGHEMTHGFDDQGRQYDGQGNLSDWWTPACAAAFKARAAAIVRQFSAYTVLDGVHLIGERTQGENIADLGGLKIAYGALERALTGRPRPLLGGFTPEQRFFLSYAIIWCGQARPEALRLRIKTDPHSPFEFRCNGPLSNLDEFARAFAVPDGAPMRRAAADRVTIW
jgi:predicted metalloendopeptidase